MVKPAIVHEVEIGDALARVEKPWRDECARYVSQEVYIVRVVSELRLGAFIRNISRTRHDEALRLGHLNSPRMRITVATMATV
jgi:hypothetical protein